MTNANVMNKAWGIAYRGQKNHGGSVKEYFAEALRLAWKAIKGEKEVTEEEMVSVTSYPERYTVKRWTNYGHDRLYVSYWTGGGHENKRGFIVLKDGKVSEIERGNSHPDLKTIVDLFKGRKVNFK